MKVTTENAIRLMNRYVLSSSDAYNARFISPLEDENMMDEFWSNGTVSSIWNPTTTTTTTTTNTTHLLSEKQAESTAAGGGGGPPSDGDNNDTTRKKEEEQKNVMQNSILAGSIAGIVSTLLFHPFDVLRTKMQAYATLPTKASSSSSSSPPPSHNRGPVAVFWTTFRHGGIRAFYTGIGLPLVAQAGYKATVFTVNNITRDAILDRKRRSNNNNNKASLTLSDVFFCGAVGGAFNAALLVAPVEFVRNQLIGQQARLAAESALRRRQRQEGLFTSSSSSAFYTTSSSKQQTKKTDPALLRGPMDVVRTTVRSHGVSGLWRGTGITVARDSVGCGCYFVVFEATKRHVAPVIVGQKDDATTKFLTTLLSGAMAGLGFWTAAMPLDTVKTWIQTDSHGSFSSVTKSIVHSTKQHGALYTTRQVFRGWEVALGRGAPSAAVTFATYTAAYEFFAKYFD